MLAGVFVVDTAAGVVDPVACFTDDEPILLRLDTGERLTFDQALRGCASGECEFTRYRFITNAPLTLSADGNVTLVKLIPERADVETPQNTHEALVLHHPGLRRFQTALVGSGPPFCGSVSRRQGCR